MVKIKIDDVEYETDDMSDNAKAQVSRCRWRHHIMEAEQCFSKMLQRPTPSILSSSPH